MRRLGATLSLTLLAMMTMVPAVQAGPPASAFSGHWHAIDPGDGSNLDLFVAGGKNVRALYIDDLASQACAGLTDQVFVSLLTGTVNGSDMHTTMRVAKCGTVNIHFTGFTIDWVLHDNGNADPSDDTLENDFGEVFSRVP